MKDQLDWVYKQEQISKSDKEMQEIRIKEKEAKKNLEDARKSRADVIEAKNRVHIEIEEHREKLHRIESEITMAKTTVFESKTELTKWEHLSYEAKYTYEKTQKHIHEEAIQYNAKHKA